VFTGRRERERGNASGWNFQLLCTSQCVVFWVNDISNFGGFFSKTAAIKKEQEFQQASIHNSKMPFNQEKG